MNLFCENKVAIDITHNQVQHDRMKQKLEAKEFRFPFVKSEDQLADILPKAFATSMHQLEEECWL